MSKTIGPIKLDKNMLDNIKIYNPKKINYTKYEGLLFNIYFMNMYFSYKYDNIYIFDYALIYTDTSKKGDTPIITFSHHLNMTIENIDGDTLNNFIIQLKKCLSDDNIRFVVISINIFSTNNIGHANCLIYDKIDNSFELFDPNESTNLGSINDEVYFGEIERILRKIHNFDNFYRPTELCIKFQNVAHPTSNYPELGFCQAWSLWYIDLKLSNANKKLTRQELITYSAFIINAKNKKQINDFIGNYSSFIYFLGLTLTKCEIDECDTNNTILTLITQFFNFIDIDILIFNNTNENAKKILKRIINNCGEYHLKKLCTTLNGNCNLVDWSNYSARKALRTIIKGFDDNICCDIYTNFINLFYNDKASAIRLDNSENRICPYDTEIINKLYNNMTTRYKYKNENFTDRESKCLITYYMINSKSAKDIVKHYAYLLLLLSPMHFDSYIEKFNIEDSPYFYTIRTLVNNFKTNRSQQEEIKDLTKRILSSDHTLNLQKILDLTIGTS